MACLRHVPRQVLSGFATSDNRDLVMRELNEAFKQDAKGVLFATAVVLGFYLGTGGLLFTNAGHLPLLWHHAGSGVWDWLEDHTPYAKDAAALPLGLISGTSYAQTVVDFSPGDTLLLYTDGITESRNEVGAELGHEGLLGLVCSLTVGPEEGPVAFGHALVARLKGFQGSGPQRDDETLILLQRQPGIGQLRTSQGSGRRSTGPARKKPR